jgi:hypothetical protein
MACSLRNHTILLKHVQYHRDGGRRRIAFPSPGLLRRHFAWQRSSCRPPQAQSSVATLRGDEARLQGCCLACPRHSCTAPSPRVATFPRIQFCGSDPLRRPPSALRLPKMVKQCFETRVVTKRVEVAVVFVPFPLTQARSGCFLKAVECFFGLSGD